jgi:hypothetical protein
VLQCRLVVLTGEIVSLERDGVAMEKHLPRSVSPQFLSGWKEIANYLGKAVRTVQRYERQSGLPVRRPPGNPRGSVVGVRAELDGWVKASPIREVLRLRNTSSEYPSPAQAIRRGVSELAQLRAQMSTLRSELRKSLQRLQDSVSLLQGELNERASEVPSTLYSPNERDLLDRSASGLITAPIKYRKAS